MEKDGVAVESVFQQHNVPQDVDLVVVVLVPVPVHHEGGWRGGEGPRIREVIVLRRRGKEGKGRKQGVKGGGERRG